MSTILNPPPEWTNQKLLVYHGTTDAHANSLLHSGIQVARGEHGTDFGRGFYTTTVRHQADYWAWLLTRQIAGSKPAVLEIELDRDDLSRLETLSFVRGDRDANDFWSLVVHCRSGAIGHGRFAHATGYFDVVIGPVAAFWQQRVAMQGADQMSFHTSAAQRLLNDPGTQRRRVW